MTKRTKHPRITPSLFRPLKPWELEQDAARRASRKDVTRDCDLCGREFFAHGLAQSIKPHRRLFLACYPDWVGE
jgi:hypothetical protein